jgi:hypothetical protein
MQHLPFPVSAQDDEAEVNILAEDLGWSPHQAAWIAAYQSYRANGGSPFSLIPHNFGLGVRGRQIKLYDSRKSSGELRRMRRKGGLKSCPVCGSPVTGALDHYLPRTVFPEFSIMRANLVPACAHCNSGSKGAKVHGVFPQRFIHPYFDDWAQHAIWYVEIVRPFKAATFMPHALPGLKKPRDEIVTFHLENVLGPQFHLSMVAEWSSLPTQIKIRDAELSNASVTLQIDRELRVALAAKGINSWQAALLRGIQRDPLTIEHLRREAIAAVLPP